MNNKQSIILTPGTTEDLKKLAVLNIQEPSQLEHSKLGAIRGPCETCKLYSKQCQGHLAYIQLPFPIIVPLLNQSILKLLSQICINCCLIPIKENNDMNINTQYKNLNKLSLKSIINCPWCQKPSQRLTIVYQQVNARPTKIPIYFQCTKIQAYKIQSILNKSQQNNNTEFSEQKVSLSQHIIQKLLLNLLGQTEVQYILRNTNILQTGMINILPVPPSTLRVVINQQNGRAINQVYSAILSQLKILQNVPLEINNLYLNPQIDPLSPTAQKQLQAAYLRIIIGCRIEMYKDTSRNSPLDLKESLLKVMNIHSATEPASALAQCLSKNGWFRTSMSSVRVNMSGRTVIVGSPMLDIDQVIIPKFFAENLYLPYRVNNMNIEKVKALISNFPNYPCVLKLLQNNISSQVSQQTKYLLQQQLKLGDIAMIQLMDNNICMVNRYPSVREESFTTLRIKVEDVKTINFPLSIIKKMGADFDGDEMQVFILPCLADCLEACNLYSSGRQFITYETGSNIIGSAPELNIGINHLQNNNFLISQYFNIFSKDQIKEFISKNNNKDFIAGIDLFQLVFNDVYIDQPNLLSKLNYEDKNNKIVNGIISKFSKDFADTSSKLLVFIYFHHSASRAIKIINSIIHLSFQTNMLAASTIFTNIILKEDQFKPLQDITKTRLEQIQNLIHSYYTQELISPPGISLKLFYNDQYNKLLTHGVQEQLTLLQDILKTNNTFMNSQYKSNINRLLDALSQKGQQNDRTQRIQIDSFYNRSLPCYPKFKITPESEGYISNALMYGLSQTEMFQCATNDRFALFQKGTTVSVSGYLGRRLNQGAGNVFVSHNGLVFSDSNILISLQYGINGYDPRCFQIIKFDKHSISIEEFDAQYKSHSRYDEMLQIRQNLIKQEKIFQQTNPKFNQFSTIGVPFIFDEESISEEELDKLFTCRITSKMSKEFKQIITQQVFNFYIYALFTLKIDNKSKYNITKKYIQCLAQAGDPVGMKSALACSQIYTQALLSAIHTVNGVLVVLQQKQTQGLVRYQELVINTNGPVIIEFTLIGKLKFDQKINEAFIAKNQTLYLYTLQPQHKIIFTLDHYLTFEKEIQQNVQDKNYFKDTQFSNYVIQIKIQIEKINYYNLKILDIMIYLQQRNQIIEEIQPVIQDENIYFIIYFNQQISKNQVQQLNEYLMSQQILGSQIFYNLQMINNTYGGFKFICNLTNDDNQLKKSSLTKLYTTILIDQESIYCNSPKTLYNQFGIVRTQLQLYQELNENMSTDAATKQIQPVHVKLMSDILTSTGIYSSFTRTEYKKQGQRDIISKMMFEQGNMFLEDEILDPQPQVLNTMLNSMIYGTQAELGSTISQVMFNQVIQLQNKKNILKELDDLE